MRYKLRVSGIAQGVGFRPFVYRLATKHRLKGHVRNLGDAGVEIEIEGTPTKLEAFLSQLREAPVAEISHIDVEKGEDVGFAAFSIVESSPHLDLGGSSIPPDLGICDQCLRELGDSANRRHNYFFITCTHCGPRFTIVDRLPYDRPNTSMGDFPICNRCQTEYGDPGDRRFHAQTIACPQCGPKIWLADAHGPIPCEDPARRAGKLLEQGSIVAIKGNGGFHIAAATTQQGPVMRLRQIFNRPQRPFAVMSPDLPTTRSFAQVSDAEARLLRSPARPIVLLRKRSDVLSEAVSPGLHNVGVMLPYTGLHAMLFDDIAEPALVMTSANRTGEPIITSNEDARQLPVDYWLLHDRRIVRRCDDSVVRMHDTPVMLRRSRGYVPAPIPIKPTERVILALGPELDVTFCVLRRDQAFLSQYIGDTTKPATQRYLGEAIEQMLDLLHVQPDVIACDLHPRYHTTRMALEWPQPLYRVQHHHAHVASMMGEYDIEEMVGIACDGMGYGPDGSAWGGEVLGCTLRDYRRAGQLQTHPMVGGDLATIYPMRMVASILPEKEEWLYAHASALPRGEREMEIVLKARSRERRTTSSCGRVLDAVAAVLGVCYERTYEGEPAMKLESLATRGRELGIEPQIKNGILDTHYLLEWTYDRLGKEKTENLARSAESYLATGLALIAVEEADHRGLKEIGFSGGVALNEHFSAVVKETVGRGGLRYLAGQRVPRGDGCISFGQALVASAQ